jgi:hypothetical protein
VKAPYQGEGIPIIKPVDRRGGGIHKFEDIKPLEENWSSSNGMRLLDRAPSTLGAGDEDPVPMGAISPCTPHSPDPQLIIQETPWGGDCPLTPVHTRCVSHCRDSIPRYV